MYRPISTLLLFGACMYAFGQGTFTLKSADLGGQATMQQVYDGFGCTGANTSPQLAWSNPPDGTKSYAVTMYDPDAPTGSGWWHWVVFDLPGSIMTLPTGAGTNGKTDLPTGAVQSITDFGTAGYGGPCPPPGHGAHQYIITVYALDLEKLGLDAKASAPMVGFNLHQHTLAKASLVFYYGR
jgi:Raf kinase inhibitor-like YbhB/YbcL family protein